MSLSPKCDACKKELKEYGALLFSPPMGTPPKKNRTRKFHICVDCYNYIKRIMEKEMSHG